MNESVSNESVNSEPDSTVSKTLGHDMNVGSPIKLKKTPVTTIESAIAKALNELIGEGASTLVSINELKFNNEFPTSSVSVSLTLTKYTHDDSDTIF